MVYKIKFLMTLFCMLIGSLKAVAQKTGRFVDSRDGKVYKTVTLGKQTWMAQDLSYSSPSGSWSLYDDNSNCLNSGRRLYNWKSASEG